MSDEPTPTEDDTPEREDGATDVLPAAGTPVAPPPTPAGDEVSASEPPTAPAGAKPRRTGGAPIWFVVIVLLLLLGAIGFAAWAYSERESLRDDATRAEQRLEDELDDAEEQAQERVEALEGDVEQLTKDNKDLKAQLKKAKTAAATAANEEQTVEDDFTSSDESELLARTRTTVEQAASAEYAACGVFALVGTTDDGQWAITHADLASNCSPNKADPGEFLWRRGSDGEWDSYDAGADGMVLCDAQSISDSEARAAIDEIC